MYDLHPKCFLFDSTLGAKNIVVIFGQNSLSLKRERTQYWVDIGSELLIDWKHSFKLICDMFENV